MYLASESLLADEDFRFLSLCAQGNPISGHELALAGALLIHLRLVATDLMFLLAACALGFRNDKSCGLAGVERGKQRGTAGGDGVCVSIDIQLSSIVTLREIET